MLVGTTHPPSSLLSFSFLFFRQLFWEASLLNQLASASIDNGASDGRPVTFDTNASFKNGHYLEITSGDFPFVSTGKGKSESIE